MEDSAMMTQTLEERLAAVESELANLKRLVTAARSDDVQRNPYWRQQVEGSMKDMPGFDELIRLGREWRQSESIDEYNARMDGDA